jgi:uncharacterized protein
MIRRALLALLLLAFAAPLLALGIPPKPTAWIVDNAGILDDAQEQAINEKCEAFFKTSKASLVTITFPSLEGEELVDYTNRVVNAWNVKGDRIAILFIFVKDRKLWIQTGYGLEGEVTDAFASDVYRNTLVPAFKEQRYYEGINHALDQLAKKIDPTFQPPASATAASGGNSPLGAPQRLPGGSSSSGDDGSNAQFVIFLAFMFVVFVLPMLARRRGRRGGGGCIGCIPMFPFGGGWGGGGTTFGGGRGGGSNWSIGGNWGGGGGSSFGGGGAGGGW